MPGFLENVGKAAVRGAARAAAKAEFAAQRAKLQGDLERREQEVLVAYARLGRLAFRAAQGGGPLPEGAGPPLLDGIRQAEAAAQAVRGELERYGGGQPGG